MFSSALPSHLFRCLPFGHLLPGLPRNIFLGVLSIGILFPTLLLQFLLHLPDRNILFIIRVKFAFTKRTRRFPSACLEWGGGAPGKYCEIFAIFNLKPDKFMASWNLNCNRISPVQISFRTSTTVIILSKHNVSSAMNRWYSSGELKPVKDMCEI